jgi:hypothetical protein
MTNTRFDYANAIPHLEKHGDATPPPPSLKLARASQPAEAGSEGRYVAVSPHGIEIEIPKELFVALQDFMKTRKSPGSITIHFREGEITCVEAVAKKTYRNP